MKKLVNAGTINRREFLGRTCAVSTGLVVGAALVPKTHAADAATYPIGIFTRPWAEYDHLTALDAIAEAGFANCGLMTSKTANKLILHPNSTPEEAQKVGEECRKRKLGILCVWGGGIPVEKSLEEGEAALKRLIDNCATAGAKCVMMGGVAKEAIYDRYYQAVANCCDYAQEKQVAICVKPHGGLNSTGEQCRKIIEKVHHKNFRLWFDPGNIFFYSEGKLNPVDDAARVDGIVSGVCIKDYLPSEDVTAKPGKVKAKPGNVMVTPGTGQVDFKKVLARLKHGGFTSGSLVIETLNPGKLPEILAEAKKAKQFLEAVVKEL